jgi:hypothetical protein
MFIAGAAVCQFPVSALDLIEIAGKIAQDGLSDHVIDAAYQTFDTISMAAYVGAFFHEIPLFLLTGSLFEFCSDATDAIFHTFQLKQPDAGLANYSYLKLGQRVMSAAAGVFCLYTLMIGGTLVAPSIAMTISLASSLFCITAYFYKNFWCNKPI